MSTGEHLNPHEPTVSNRRESWAIGGISGCVTLAVSLAFLAASYQSVDSKLTTLTASVSSLTADVAKIKDDVKAIAEKPALQQQQAIHNHVQRATTKDDLVKAQMIANDPKIAIHLESQ